MAKLHTHLTTISYILVWGVGAAHIVLHAWRMLTQ
jgi:hypothetical protein